MSDDALGKARPADIPLATDPQEIRRKRKRLLIILASISIGWKVVVFTLGAAIPHWFVDDGLADLPVDARAYGDEARTLARSLYDGPIERWGFVRQVRLLAIDTLPDAAGLTGCGAIPLGARVRAYSYFAIPYSEVRVRCGQGEVEYRVFRRRGTPPAS